MNNRNTTCDLVARMRMEVCRQTSNNQCVTLIKRNKKMLLNARK